MKGLSGKVAVITGGSSGIGLAIAQAFAAEGVKTVIADVADGSQAVQSIQQSGVRRFSSELMLQKPAISRRW